MSTVGKIVAMATLGVTAMAVADPVCDSADLIHRWSFNGNLTDSVGSKTATLSDTSTCRWTADSKQIRLCPNVTTDLIDDGTAGRINGHGTAYVDLGTGLVPSEAGGSVTIEIWATPLLVNNWSRIVDFGSNDKNYLCMTWTQGTSANTDRIQIQSDGTSILAADNALKPALGVPCHISLVITPTDDGKATLTYAKRDAVTGAVLASGSTTTSSAWDASTIAGFAHGYLGRSQFDGDSDAAALYDEVRIWKTALTSEQLDWSARLGPDTLPTVALADATLSLTSEFGTVSVNDAAGVGSGSVAISRESNATLAVTAADGYNFLRWTGDTGRIVAGDATSDTITVATGRGDLALTAEYEPQTSAVYARIENNEFKYLTANKKPAQTPEGGMNEGITILFSSDGEYQQLKNHPADVAKAADVEVDGTVKLNGFCDWTAIDYSLGENTVDINSKSLVTKSVRNRRAAASAIPLVNADFQADGWVGDDGQMRTAPQGWEVGGGVWLLRKSSEYGDSNEGKNGSVWCMTVENGYIQQRFTLPTSGSLKVSYSNASCCPNWGVTRSDYQIMIDSNVVKDEDSIDWRPAARNFTVQIGAGTHTIRFGCNYGRMTNHKGIYWDNIRLEFTPDGGSYTSSSNNGIVNGNFDAANLSSDVDHVVSAIDGWTLGGRVWLLYNHTDYGYDVRGSVTCMTEEEEGSTPGGWIEQKFRVIKAGNVTVKYKRSCTSNAGTQCACDYTIWLDGEVVQTEQSVSWVPREKSFTVSVGVGEHAIRFGCTNNYRWNTCGIIWDNISISGAPGVLEFRIPEGTTVTNNDVPIAGGANMAVVKSGAGTFVANKASQTYSGGTLVTGGQLTIGNNTALGAASEVTVDPDGTLELNGKGDLYNYSFVLNGGVLQNTGTDLTEGTAQIAKLRLTAASTFKPTGSYGLVGSAYAATTLDLAGHTLTVPIGSGKSFYLFNTTLTAGTLDVAGDGWLVADKTAVNASDVNLLANCALDVRVPFSVKNYEALYTGTSNAGAETLAVSGTFKPHSSYYHGVTLANNAKIDLTACQDTVKTPGLFTSGANAIIFPTGEEAVPANVFVELHGRTLTTSKLIGWNGIPANVNFIPTEATQGDRLTLAPRASGLYVPRSTLILFR